VSGRGNITQYGFDWGSMKVERTASLPDDRVVLTVRTGCRSLTIYASKIGQSLRVFAGNRDELKPSTSGVADRDHWIGLFNRLDAAVARHRRKDSAWADEFDEALHTAHDKVLKAASRGTTEEPKA